jgi:hypothetical protein
MFTKSESSNQGALFGAGLPTPRTDRPNVLPDNRLPKSGTVRRPCHNRRLQHLRSGARRLDSFPHAALPGEASEQQRFATKIEYTEGEHGALVTVVVRDFPDWRRPHPQ